MTNVGGKWHQATHWVGLGEDVMTAKVRALWTLYKHGRVTKAQLRAKVPAVLTAEEYKLITGEGLQADK